ncbi:MAG: acyl-CoA carboxylase subunit beta [Planctomycetes bacterium]|nr:acyl-CoA carboxylase subunit beta [Planctomycetota bacterium]
MSAKVQTAENSPAQTALEQLLKEIEEREAVIRQGGGERGIARQHRHGRLTARERIALLCDRDRDDAFFELGLWAAEGMYEEAGGVPAAGVIVGLGRVSGRLCIIVANDATVKAGAFFPATCKKVIRAQHCCLRTRLPIIYLVDSAGVFLPMQDEIFPDEDDFGRIFRHNAVISAKGIPQFSAIMGNCVAGGGYLPVMCDKLLMTEGSGLYLAGPALVKAAIGQETSHEELGGASMHAAISGTIDFLEPNEELCLERLRRLLGKLGAPPTCPFDRVTPVAPKRPAERVYDPACTGKRGEYDTRDLLQHIVDADTFDEYKAEYGQSIVCGYARVDGWAVGIVANQKKLVKPARGPIQFPSVIYTDSANKMSRFILTCNQYKMPIIFIQDVSGFMVGRDSEQDGIIRCGAKVVNAVSNSIVPKITVITGGSFGAGNYALCGRAYDPTFIYAWPMAKYAVMAGASAAKTLLGVEIASLKRKGHEPDAEEMKDLERRINEHYEKTMDIRYGAARGWIDEIIKPADTRAVLSLSLEAVAHVGELEPLRTGVFQV